LKYARASDMSLATSVSPLAGIIFAMVLLGENPGVGFVPGAALILTAVYIGQMRDTTWQKLRISMTSQLIKVQYRMEKTFTLITLSHLPGGRA
ncbi:MAG: hypothetical protein AAFN80_16610, partial [Pseudomonadota bacterium]